MLRRDYDTFPPYNLKQVIDVLNHGLLDNFYNMPLDAARQKVHDELTKLRISCRDAEIERLREKLKIAREDRIDETSIGGLQEQLGDALLNKQDDKETEFSSNLQFLNTRMSQMKSISSDKKDQLSFSREEEESE